MKTIKLSTLEARFQKLHAVANYAEDCMGAIAMHADRLLDNNYTDALATELAEFNNAVEVWSGELAKFASFCQQVESQYYEHLVENNTKSELIEAVPTYSPSEIPDQFQMTDLMYQIGYYTEDDDIYQVKGKTFTDEDILADIDNLFNYAVLCIKALPNMNYTGIWEHVGQKAVQIHDLFYEEPSPKLQRVLARVRTKA